MQRVRHSKQRDASKAYLLSTTSHPTAEAVYEQLQSDFPNISLGTVYRNLNFLVDHGEALRLDMGDGNDHFCRKCHHVLDLEMDGINHIDVIANAGFDGIIEGHTIYFTGLCPDCAQAKMP